MQLLEQGSRPFDLLGLGEVMLRLTPPDRERLSMSEAFEKTVGGSELNVMAGAAMLGARSGILTKLPDNALGQFVRNRIRYTGVSDDFLVMDESHDARLGVYYYEMGAYPRKPSVLYDRARSSFTTLTAEELLRYDPCHSTRVFHVSGITLGLGESSRATAMDLLTRFKRAGALLSFDINYRAALWGEAECRAVVETVLPLVDILFVSEETSRRMLERKGSNEEIARGFAETYGCGVVAMTMRTASSPLRHNWASLLYEAATGTIHTEPAYEDIEVVDRIGSGDAYVGGVLGAWLTGRTLGEALSTGNAMAAIKNTIYGDLPSSSWEELNGVIRSHRGGEKGEMNR